MSQSRQAQVTTRRPFTVEEMLLQLRRRWYWVALCFAVGLGLVFFATSRFELSYEADALIRIQPFDAIPQMDEEVNIPLEELPQPEDIAKNMQDVAVSSESIGALFEAKPELFAADLAKGRPRFELFIREYAKVVPISERQYQVVARGRSPEQAQVLADWIADAARRYFVTVQRERLQVLAKFTKRQADAAGEELRRHEDQMVAFLQEHPSLMVRPPSPRSHTADRRLETAGPDRMRIQAMFRQAGASLSDPELGGLLAERDRLRAQLRVLESPGTVDPSSGTAKLRILEEARQLVEALRARGMSEDHPSLKQALRQVKRLEQEAHQLEYGQNVKEVGKSTAKLRAELRAVTRKINGRVKKTSATPLLESRWGELMREQKLLLSRYDGLNRLAATAQFGSQLSDYEKEELAKVVVRAAAPVEPVGARPWMLIAAGGFFSLMAGMALVLALGFFDRHIYSRKEVPELLGVPLLATLDRLTRRHRKTALIPTQRPAGQLIGWCEEEFESEVGVRPQERSSRPQRYLGQGEPSGGSNLPVPARNAMLPAAQFNRGRPTAFSVRTIPMQPPEAAELFVLQRPRCASADQVRMLATQLLNSRDVHQLQAVVVASWEPGVGRTTLATNLALALAETRRRTLLVDASGHDAAATRLLGLRPDREACLYEQLSARLETRLSRWTIYRLAESLFVIPASGARLPAAPVLSSAAFAELVDSLRGGLDVIVFDTTPVSLASDAVIIHQHADAVVGVVGQHRSSLTGFAELSRRLEENRLLGAVFNRHC